MILMFLTFLIILYLYNHLEYIQILLCGFLLHHLHKVHELFEIPLLGYMVFYDKNLKRVYAGPLDIELGISLVDVDETGFWALVYPMEFSEKSPFYPSLKDKLKAYPNNPMLVKIKLNGQLD